MTKRTRTRIFYLLVIVFLVLGGGAVFYAEGWRVQFNPFLLDKVGGIYIRPYPADATVLVDGKPSGFAVRIFDQGHFFSNLFPGNYDVTVQKTGYLNWTDALPVRPSFVTSLSKLVLVPATGTAVTSTPISDIAVFGNQLAIAADRVYLGGTAVPGSGIAAGTDDGQRILTSTAVPGRYLWTDLQTGTTTPFNASVNDVFSAVPGNGLLLLGLNLNDMGTAVNSLRLINMGTGRVVHLITGGVSAYDESSTRIGWTTYNFKTNRSSISFYDLLSNTLLADVDTVPGWTTKMKLLGPDSVMVLQNGNNYGPPFSNGLVYNVSLTNGVRQELDRNAADFYLSPDGNAVAVIEKNGLAVMPTGGTGNYFFFAIPGGGAENIIWYRDGEHLFLVQSDRVKFLSLADAHLRNVETVVAGFIEIPNVQYVPDTNSLYVINGDKLLQFNFPS